VDRRTNTTGPPTKPFRAFLDADSSIIFVDRLSRRERNDDGRVAIERRTRRTRSVHRIALPCFTRFRHETSFARIDIKPFYKTVPAVLRRKNGRAIETFASTTVDIPGTNSISFAVRWIVIYAGRKSIRW